MPFLLIALSFKEIITEAIKKSPVIESINMQLAQLDADINKVEAAKGFGTMGRFEYQDIKQERLFIFLPSNIKTQSFDFTIYRSLLGLETGIFTGIKTTQDDSIFSTINPKYETKVGASLEKKFFGFDRIKESELTKLKLETAKISNLIQLENYILELRNIFLRIYLMENMLRITENAIMDYKNLLDITTKLVDIGIKEEIDLLQIQSRILMLEFEYERSNKTLLELKNSFEALTEVYIDKAILDDINMDVTKEAFEVKLLRKKIESSKLELETVKTNYIPEVNINISYLYSGLGQTYNRSYESLRSNPQFLGQLTFSKPLSGYSRFERESYEKKYLSDMKALEAAIKRNENNIKNIKIRIQALKDEAKKIEQLINNYTRQITLLQRRYENGRISLAELIRIKDEYRNILKLETEVEAMLFTTKIDLLKETGVLLEWVGF
ncbi:MAG: TolC family protein [bacterium]|nr:TolC family protein [bacterium]